MFVPEMAEGRKQNKTIVLCRNIDYMTCRAFFVDQRREYVL